MTLLTTRHNQAAAECMAMVVIGSAGHSPTLEEKVRASEAFQKEVLVAAHMEALHDAYILEMGAFKATEEEQKKGSAIAKLRGGAQQIAGSSPASADQLLAIASLKPTTLKHLKVGKVHRSCVLHGTFCVNTLCTKVGPSGSLLPSPIAVNLLEDEEGRATPIYIASDSMMMMKTPVMLGNGSFVGSSSQAQILFPLGSKVAVREPYLTRLPNGEVILSVEDSSDLLFLSLPVTSRPSAPCPDGEDDYRDGTDKDEDEDEDDGDGDGELRIDEMGSHTNSNQGLLKGSLDVVDVDVGPDVNHKDASKIEGSGVVEHDDALEKEGFDIVDRNRASEDGGSGIVDHEKAPENEGSGIVDREKVPEDGGLGIVDREKVPENERSGIVGHEKVLENDGLVIVDHKNASDGGGSGIVDHGDASEEEGSGAVDPKKASDHRGLGIADHNDASKEKISDHDDALKEEGLGISHHDEASKKGGLGISDHGDAPKEEGLGISDHDDALDDEGLGDVDHDIASKEAELSVADHVRAAEKAELGVVDHVSTSEEAELGVSDHDNASKEEGLGISYHHDAPDDGGISTADYNIASKEAGLGVVDHVNESEEAESGVLDHDNASNEAGLGVANHEEASNDRGFDVPDQENASRGAAVADQENASTDEEGLGRSSARVCADDGIEICGRQDTDAINEAEKVQGDEGGLGHGSPDVARESNGDCHAENARRRAMDTDVGEGIGRTDANEMNAIDDVRKHEADDEADDEHADGSESDSDGTKPKERDGSIRDGDGDGAGDGDGDEGPSVLRVRGNELFARGEFTKASMMYTMALKAAARTLIGEDEAANSGYGDESEKKRSLSMNTKKKKKKMLVMATMMEEEVLSLSNRAEIWLRLGEHGKALEDAEAAIASIHEHHRLLRDLSQHHHHHHPRPPRANEDLAMAKALFRKARALMGLWRCHEALPLLHSLQHLSKDPELFRAIATCKSSLAHHQAVKKKNRSKKNRKSC